MKYNSLYVSAFILVLVMMPMTLSGVGFDDITIHGFVSQEYLKSSDNNVFADTEDGRSK